VDPREQRAAQTAEIPAGERLKEGGTAELRHTRYLISLVSVSWKEMDYFYKS